MSEHDRPNPDTLLKRLADDEKRSTQGKLRIFLGMSAGVGKTFAMLKAAHARQAEGRNVLIGLVETHGRVETQELLTSLTLLPKKKIAYKGVEVEEFDIDELLRLKPEIAVVDELAHTNAPGSRHPKRYQDVLEILAAGIDVYTAMNVQHLESRKDLVEQITGVPIRETVPDTVFEVADQIEVIDITPVDLLKRLKAGKVYLADRAERAAQNFFKIESLTALREMALRFAAERVDQDLQSFHDVKTTKPWQSNERLLVAVSHSPYSERLIRTTRRLAYNLEAPWIAVYVDTGVTLNDEDHQQLAKNLALARELKAEVISTTDKDVSAALKRVARQKNVTQVIVGRPTKRYIKDLFEGGTLLDRLVQDSWEIDVHVIRQDREPTRSNSFSLPKLNFQTGFIPYWNTFWLIVGIGLVSGFAEPAIGYQAVGFIFLLGVLAVGGIATLGPTIFAATLCAVIWNFFFIPPRLTIAISKPEDVILCLTFFAVAVITGTLANRLRSQEKLIREREERTNVLYETLKDISTSSGKEEFLERVVRRMGLVLGGECGVILKNQEGGLTDESKYQYVLKLDERALAVAQWSFSNRKPAGWSTTTLAQSKNLYLPIEGDQEISGVFIFKPVIDRALSTEQENLLYSVARQLGLSLERHFIQKRFEETDKLRASEVLHQTLLNSISHEMRTPLTAILGSATVLADRTSHYSEEIKLQLADEVLDAGARLNRVIENLLDMSRLNSGAMSLHLEWHDLSDLIGITVKRLGKNLSGHTLEIKIPDDLPLLNLDYRLFEHALSNILFNAATYTPEDSKISISASVSGSDVGKQVQLTIEDNGPGIPEDSLDKLFEKFYRVPGSPTGGTGLGLSIVKSIVELHGGRISVENLKPHGSKFLVALPLGDAPTAPSEEALV